MKNLVRITSSLLFVPITLSFACAGPRTDEIKTVLNEEVIASYDKNIATVAKGLGEKNFWAYDDNYKSSIDQSKKIIMETVSPKLKDREIANEKYCRGGLSVSQKYSFDEKDQYEERNIQLREALFAHINAHLFYKTCVKKFEDANGKLYEKFVKQLSDETKTIKFDDFNEFFYDLVVTELQDDYKRFSEGRFQKVIKFFKENATVIKNDWRYYCVQTGVINEVKTEGNEQVKSVLDQLRELSEREIGKDLSGLYTELVDTLSRVELKPTDQVLQPVINQLVSSKNNCSNLLNQLSREAKDTDPSRNDAPIANETDCAEKMHQFMEKSGLYENLTKLLSSKSAEIIESAKLLDQMIASLTNKVSEKISAIYAIGNDDPNGGFAAPGTTGGENCPFRDYTEAYQYYSYTQNFFNNDPHYRKYWDGAYLAYVKNYFGNNRPLYIFDIKKDYWMVSTLPALLENDHISIEEKKQNKRIARNLLGRKRTEYYQEAAKQRTSELRTARMYKVYLLIELSKKLGLELDGYKENWNSWDDVYTSKAMADIHNPKEGYFWKVFVSEYFDPNVTQNLKIFDYKKDGWIVKILPHQNVNKSRSILEGKRHEYYSLLAKSKNNMERNGLLAKISKLHDLACAIGLEYRNDEWKKIEIARDKYAADSNNSSLPYKDRLMAYKKYICNFMFARNDDTVPETGLQAKKFQPKLFDFTEDKWIIDILPNLRSIDRARFIMSKMMERNINNQQNNSRYVKQMQVLNDLVFRINGHNNFMLCQNWQDVEQYRIDKTNDGLTDKFNKYFRAFQTINNGKNVFDLLQDAWIINVLPYVSNEEQKSMLSAKMYAIENKLGSFVINATSTLTEDEKMKLQSQHKALFTLARELKL